MVDPAIAVFVGVLWAIFVIWMFVQVPKRTKTRWVEWMHSPELLEVLKPVVDALDQRVTTNIMGQFEPKIDSMGREIPSDFINSLVRSFKRHIASDMAVTQHSLDQEALDAMEPEERQMLEMNDFIDAFTKEIIGVEIPPALKVKLLAGRSPGDLFGSKRSMSVGIGGSNRNLGLRR